MPISSSVTDVLADEAELAALYRSPAAVVRSKVRAELDPAMQGFIGASPFVLVATADAEGNNDVSPRGGPAGFVKILDDRRLALPDLNGNNLLDSIHNILANPRVGLLFVLPGRDETVRVNGRAVLTTAADVLDLFAGELRRPKLAIGIEIEQAYVHCAKAFRRGRVWDAASWAEYADAPDGFDILSCQLSLSGDLAELRARFEAGYAADLAADLPVVPAGDQSDG